MHDSADPPDIDSRPAGLQSTRANFSEPGPGFAAATDANLTAPEPASNTGAFDEKRGVNGDASQDLGKAGAKPENGGSPPPQMRSKHSDQEKPSALTNTPARDPPAGTVAITSNGVSGDTAAQGATPPTKLQRIWAETRRSAWLVLTYTWLNVLLVFVPVGIIAGQIDGIHGGVVFAMNSISIIPLAGLLAFATESVAAKMGDAIGALLNVTFGNAVELIIFIIALSQNKIRIVQASLLGSILANLLLILGMGFFLGGLRYREQVSLNSPVTRISLTGRS